MSRTFDRKLASAHRRVVREVASPEWSEENWWVGIDLAKVISPDPPAGYLEELRRVAALCVAETDPPPPSAPKPVVSAPPVDDPARSSPPVQFAGGLCRWVPRHEADAMRAQDMREYHRRLAEQERRRYLGWD
jgi:hypothetical protein